MKGLNLSFKGYLAILAVVCVQLQGTSYAQTKAAAMFLTIKPGARANAMGGAQVATAGDFYSIYFNPAGLGNVRRVAAGFYRVNWLKLEWGFKGFPLTFAGGGYGFSKGFIGAAIDYYDLGELVVTVVDTNDPRGYREVSRAHPYDMALQVSYGHRVSEHINWSVGLKWIHQDRRGLVDPDAWAVDIGILSKLPEVLSTFPLGGLRT